MRKHYKTIMLAKKKKISTYEQIYNATNQKKLLKKSQRIFLIMRSVP